MPSNHLILYHPLLLLPSIFPRIRVFSNESALRIRWPKYWSFSLSISPSNEYSGLISFRMDWIGSPCSPRDSQESSPTTVQKHQFFGIQLSLWSNSHIHKWHLNKATLKLESYFSQWNNWYLSLFPSFCAIYVQLCSPQSQISEGAKTQHHITDYNFI